MKKKGIALLSALMLTTAFGGLATIGASAAVEDVPEELTYSNVALGKEVSFRSLTDMDTVLTPYAFYPDKQGDAFPGTGSGAYDIRWGDMGRLTDGNAKWDNFQGHSTAPGTHGWAYLDLGLPLSIDEIKVGYMGVGAFKT